MRAPSNYVINSQPAYEVRRKVIFSVWLSVHRGSGYPVHWSLVPRPFPGEGEAETGPPTLTRTMTIYPHPCPGQGEGYPCRGEGGVSCPVLVNPPCPCGQTHTCENITFRHPSDTGGNKYVKQYGDEERDVRWKGRAPLGGLMGCLNLYLARICHYYIILLGRKWGGGGGGVRGEKPKLLRMSWNHFGFGISGIQWNFENWKTSVSIHNQPIGRVP